MNGKRNTRFGPCVILVLSYAFLAPDSAHAGSVTWTVDPAASSVQLTIPDQQVNVTNIGNITVTMRDAGDTTAWTDAGGRRASVQGNDPDGLCGWHLDSFHQRRAQPFRNPAG